MLCPRVGFFLCHVNEIGSTGELGGLRRVWNGWGDNSFLARSFSGCGHVNRHNNSECPTLLGTRGERCLGTW